MKALLLGIALLANPAHAADAPFLYADLAKAGFKKVDWRRLSEREVAAFYQAYPADREMLERIRIGDEVTTPLEECISGEAPPLAEARKKFPLHYPLLGRMKDVTGTFEWRGKSLFFRTARQIYPTDEAHIHLRLNQLGFTRRSGPREATVEAVWFVNREDGLRLIYLQKIDLH